MKIYKISQFITEAIPYIILKDGTLERVDNTTHLRYIQERFDLTHEICNEFESTFGELIDWDNDDDMAWVNLKIKDFMLSENIFCVVVDRVNEQVYVRPNLTKKPDRIQMKKLSDWAIENGYNENIIIDYVAA